MSRIALAMCFIGLASSAADPPSKISGGTASQATAKGITPGGRGPARPRGEAFATLLPAAGHAVELVLAPFTGSPSLAKQSTVELALFGNTRPIHVRVVTRANGKSLAEAWNEHLQTLFHAFDRNGDGYLNRYEFEYIFSPAGVLKLLQGKAYIPYQDGDPGPNFDAADKDKDGRVSFAEFRAYYTEAVRDVVALSESVETGKDYVRQSQAIFEMLDRNKDGAITADECKDVNALVRQFDKNGDESLSREEIPAARLPFRPKIGRVTSGPGHAPPAQLVAATGKLPDSAIDLILKHYDKNKDGVLTKDELDPDLFAVLDKNGDGKLTREELATWQDGAPDLIATLSVGPKAEHCTVEVSGPNGANRPEWAAVIPILPGHVVLRADGRVVEFAAPTPRNALRDLDGSMDFAWPAGPDGRAVPAVREDDLVNRNQIFRVMFDHMDFDGNGAVTYAEYQKYLKLQQTTAGFPVTVSYGTRPVDLFQLLDENGDGRLSRRELRAAYDKLIALEPSGGPAVTPAALTPTATVRIVRPTDTGGPGTGASPPSPPAPTDESVPLWFRKMDLNNDGELSKKEFLGSAEHFKLLDTNGDGVISIEEAKAYEAKRKKK